MTPVLGGGFQVTNTAVSSPSAAAMQSEKGTRVTSSFTREPRGATAASAAGATATPTGGGGGGGGGLGESASEPFLLGVDGHVYQGDPELLAAEKVLVNEKASRAGPVFKIPNAVVAQR